MRRREIAGFDILLIRRQVLASATRINSSLSIIEEESCRP
jgi:hypothetical protein